MNFDNIIEFWFNELTPKQWYFKDSILDKKIRPLLGTLSKSSAENIGYRNAIKVYNLNPQMFD